MPTQRYLNVDVVEAARNRIRWVFDNYETVICSISGGKDSTVMAHLTLQEANRCSRRVGLFFLDEEAMYSGSVEQVERILNWYPENCYPLWLQIPFGLTNAVSAEQSQLNCWEPGQHKIWMRSKRKDGIHAIPWDPDKQVLKNRSEGLDYYAVIENFSRQYPDAVFLVGLRADGESINRRRAVSKNPIVRNGTRIYWGTQRYNNHALYPIYDWLYSDVWRYIGDQNLLYNRVYDQQLMLGYSPASMRVSSLVHERSFKALADLQSIEPKTYAKLLKRVKGISMAAETAKAAKMFRVTKLPKNFSSWIDYRDFLISTHLDQEHLPLMLKRFKQQLNNQYVARQQCRQLILNDFPNNLPVDNRPDPRDELIAYYREVL